MIEVQTGELRQALAIADRVRERRATVPVLQYVRASANGAFRIEATDLDTSAVVEIGYTGKEDESGLCIPEAHRLRAALGQVGGEATRIGFGEEFRTKVESGALAVSLKGLPSDDFPGVHRIDEVLWQVEFGTDVLAQLARAMPAISTEETRYYLNGLCVKKVGEWTWQFTATDGHRLHMVNVPLPGATGDLPDGVIIPRQFLSTMLALFARSKDPVTLRYGFQRPRNSDGTPADGGGAVRVEVCGTVRGAKVALATKLIDGTYPAYERVIPTDIPHGMTVNRAALVSAVQAVAGFGDGKVRAVKLAAKPDAIEVSLTSALGIDAALSFPARHDLPDGYVIGFNGNYLIDMLAQMRGDEVHFALGKMDEAKPGQSTTAWHPALIRDPAETILTCVLMPMRV